MLGEKLSNKSAKRLTTTKQLEALTSEDSGQVYSMGSSMRGRVRLSTEGVINVYVEWRYRFNQKSRTLHIGTYPEMSLSQLNAKRKEMQVLLGMGIDPIEHLRKLKEQQIASTIQELADIELQKQNAMAQRERIQQEIAQQQARITVIKFFNTWKTLELRRRKDGGAEALRMFNKDVFPYIGELALEDVKRAHIQDIVDRVTMRGGVRMNKAVLSAMRQMFNFAVDREIIDIDPTARIKKSSLGKDTERDRVLSSLEIINLFVKMPESGLSMSAQLALKIQFATMTRISEVLGAKWTDVSMTEHTWRIPETKNGTSHDIYLSEFALEKLTQLHEISGHGIYLFPSESLNSSVCSKTVTKQVADRQRENGQRLSNRTKQTDALILSGGQWRPHDLRRTGATIAVDLGIPPEAIERCLNHKEQSKMKRIYQRAGYANEKKRAWQLLGDKLSRLEREAMTGESTIVIPLRSA